MNHRMFAAALLGVTITAPTASADEAGGAPAVPVTPPVLGRRASTDPRLLGYGAYPSPSYGYGGPAPGCAGGTRLVSSEGPFYSVPLFIAGLIGVAASPLVGVAVGYPIHVADPGSDGALYGGFISAFVVLAAGVSLAVVGGHRVTREVYAVSGLGVRPTANGVTVSF
jgi:hypothetical protein